MRTRVWGGAMLLGAATLLAACGGGSRDPVGPNVGIVGLQVADRTAAGSSAVFRATVVNPGGVAVDGIVVRFDSTSAFTPGAVSVTCTATVGATCPSALGAEMRIDTLPGGRSLTFGFSVPVPADARGELSGRVRVDSPGDPDDANNGGTVVTIAEDGRNGTYRAYAADGREYELAIDFDAGRYTMGGSGELAFTRNADGDYVVAGNVRLRTATDLVVGGHDFGAGVLPYVAARRFVGEGATLAGAFNLVTRNVAADGASAATRAATARFSGNELAVCQDDFQVVLTQNCPVGSLRTYALAIDGDLITGTDTQTGRPDFRFRIARSGASSLLLAAGPSTTGIAGDDTRQLRIGLLEGSALAGGRVRGPAVGADGRADWVTIVLEPTSYAAQGANIDDVAGLVRPTNSAPLAMLRGAPTPTLAGAPVWVMQSLPLVVAFGNVNAPTGTTPASGLLQIALP